ncbi:hypothetical protein BHM03_00000703 [Ensete ventricosum]|nr:hypothetical protein BHM03_00000703 [Ensete ventricosum]
MAEKLTHAPAAERGTAGGWRYVEPMQDDPRDSHTHAPPSPALVERIPPLPLGFVPPGTTSPFPPSLPACRGTARSTIPTFKVPRTKATCFLVAVVWAHKQMFHSRQQSETPPPSSAKANE